MSDKDPIGGLPLPGYVPPPEPKEPVTVCAGPKCSAHHPHYNHSIDCKYEYMLNRLNLSDSSDLRLCFWDAHGETHYNDDDMLLVPEFTPSDGAPLVQHDSDCSTHNRGVPDLLGPCDCSAIAGAVTHPVVDGVYKHYKGGEYIVLANAKDDASGDPVVVYALRSDEKQAYVRPLGEFMGKVGDVPRFALNGLMLRTKHLSPEALVRLHNLIESGRTACSVEIFHSGTDQQMPAPRDLSKVNLDKDGYPPAGYGDRNV